MSYRRAQRRELNLRVMLDNRLSTLTNAHNYLGDLHIERNATIGGNLDISGDLRARSYYATGNYYLNNYVLIPAGTIIQSAAINEPDGWFDCNGRTLSVFVNADLFNAIGYAYSVGFYRGADVNNNFVADLSFNIPDMRGRVGIGYGHGSGLTARNLGDISGAETHTLTPGEMPSHSHTSNATGYAGGGPGLVSSGTNTANTPGDNSPNEPNLYGTVTALSIYSTGSDLSHNNMQPYVVLRYLIKY
jgi:microcystin-dependent protein